MGEFDLWTIVEGEAIVPTNPALFTEHNKKVAIVKRIILDSVKDHLIPHIVEKLAKIR
jgi:hypothetical protein